MENFGHCKLIHYYRNIYYKSYVKNRSAGRKNSKTKTGILASLDGLFGNVNICCVKFLFIWPFFKTQKKKRIFIVQLSFKFQCAVLDSVKYVTSFLFNIFSVYLLWQTESYNDTSIPKGGNYFIYWKSQCAQMKYIHIYLWFCRPVFYINHYSKVSVKRPVLLNGMARFSSKSFSTISE